MLIVEAKTGVPSLDDDWSDADSSADTDGYDTVYTSSSGDYSDSSNDEEEPTKLYTTKESNSDQVLAEASNP